MWRILAVTLLLTIGHQAGAQTYSTKDKKAIASYEEGLRHYDFKRNDEAKAAMLKALKHDDKFIEPRILLGDICADMGNFEEAAAEYQKVVDQDADYFVNAQFRLAQNLILMGRYADALRNLEAYVLRKRVNPQMREKAAKLTETARFGEVAVAHPVPFDPKNLGTGINTTDFEYFPALTADERTLIFTRNQRLNGGMGMQEDFYVSQRGNSGWERAMNLGEPINTDENEGAPTISANGRVLTFTACNRPDGMGSCDLKISQKVGERWSPSTFIGPPVSSNKWESQPSLSADGRTLYYASNRAGGQGGMDIWVSRMDADGLWGMPENLGDRVNSKGNEQTPYIHPDGRTLYFASDGHVGLGSNDIFVTRMADDGSWSRPLNLGYPINSWKDEIGLIVGASGSTAYYASDRAGGMGGLDLYSFELHADARPTPVTFVRGKVTDAANNYPLQATIELIDLSTNKTVSVTESDRVNGQYLVCLPVNRKYALNVSRPDYLFFSDHFSLDTVPTASKPFSKDVRLQPVKFGEKVVLRNIFFESGSAALQPQSVAELEKLQNFLMSNMSLSIEIGGHTDNVGKDEDNLTLSDNRAKAVRDWLIDHGVKDSRLTAKGYGETQPIATNDTPEGRAENRRTEFTVKERK